MTDLWAPVGVAGDSLLQRPAVTQHREHVLAPVDLVGSLVAVTDTFPVQHLVVGGRSVGHVDFGKHPRYKDPVPVGEFFGAPLLARLSREEVKKLEFFAHGLEWSVVREGKSMVLRRADSRVASYRETRVPAERKSDFESQAELSWTPAAAPADLMLHALICTTTVTGCLVPLGPILLGAGVVAGRVVAEEARDLFRDIRQIRRDRNRGE